MVGKVASLQELVISSVTDLHSPPITFSEMLCLKILNLQLELQNFKNILKNFIAQIFVQRTTKLFCNVKQPLIIES